MSSDHTILQRHLPVVPEATAALGTRPGAGDSPIDELCINTIRTLAMDAVQAANSGHPGTPMALAPVAYCLWQQFLRFDPQDPIWGGRPRHGRDGLPAPGAPGGRRPGPVRRSRRPRTDDLPQALPAGAASRAGMS
jgi:hypothetical protein